MIGTGAGAATTAGIDFQQRLGAFAIANALCGLRIKIALQLPLLSKISAIQFETKDIVDDLVIHATDGNRIFTQAKRTLSFSNSIDSTLGNVLEDFGDNLERNPGEKTHHLLAISPECSGTIRHDLSRILDLIRISSTAHPYKPANKRHSEIYQTLLSLVDTHLRRRGRQINNRNEILRSIFIREFSIEASSPQENAILIALTQRFGDLGNLVWSTIITDTFTFARSRAVVDIEAYEKELRAKLLAKEDNTSQKVHVRVDGPLKGWRHIFKGKTATAMEFLAGSLVEGPHHIPELSIGCGHDKVVIMELFRFNDSCAKKVQFEGSRFRLNSGYEIELVCRSGTLVGVQRFLDASPGLLGDKTLVLMAARHNGAPPEDNNCAVLYRESLDKLITEQAQNPLCSVCSEPLFAGRKLLVEIDELGKPNRAATIHADCYLVPMRILGEMQLSLADRFPSLGNFDIEKWMGNLATGQGCRWQIAELRRVSKGASLLLYWGGVKTGIVGTNWALRLNLDNGSHEYAFDRGRLHRMTKGHAERFSARMNKAIEERRGTDLALGYTLGQRRFGTKSQLEEVKAPTEVVCEIVGAEVERISSLTARGLDLFENWYAPICVLTERDSGDPVALGFFVFLLSDPMEWSDRVPALQAQAILPKEISFSVLSTDAEVDGFLLRTFSDGYQVLIDPEFDSAGNLMGGTELSPLPPEAEVG